MHEGSESLRKKVAADYDAIADHWNQTRTRPWGEFIFLEPLLRPGMSILDAGCGNGRLVAWLDERLPRYEYLGIDHSKKLLEKARTNAPGRSFQYADLTTFRRKGQYDLIACIAVLHHLPSRERLRVLKNFHRSLAPGGTVFLTVWNLWQPRYLRFVLQSYLTGWPRECRIPFAGKVDRYVHAFTPRDLIRLFEKAGFQDTQAYFTDGEKHATFWNGRNILVTARV